MCGMNLNPGDRIPAEGSGPYDNAGNCVQNMSAGELFYGFGYPFGSTANTGYYKAEAATIYMIVDATGHEYLVLTLDAPFTEPGGYFGIEIETEGLDELNVLLMDDVYEQTRVKQNMEAMNVSHLYETFRPFNESQASGTRRAATRCPRAPVESVRQTRMHVHVCCVLDRRNVLLEMVGMLHRWRGPRSSTYNCVEHGHQAVCKKPRVRLATVRILE